MGTYLELEIYDGAQYHTYQNRKYYSAHISWHMNTVHRDKSCYVAEDCKSVWYKSFLPVSQFLNTPSVYFLEDVYTEHRKKNGKTIY